MHFNIVINNKSTLSMIGRRFAFALCLCFVVISQLAANDHKHDSIKHENVNTKSIEIKKRGWTNNAAKFWENNPNPIMYFQNTLKSDGQIKLKPYDSLANHIQQYDPTYNLNIQEQNLGNIGKATNQMIYNPYNSVGFSYGRRAFEGYMYSGDSVRFYNNRKYFTSVSYVMGNGKENVLHLLHSQNLHKGLYLTLDYRLFNRTGKYVREKSDDHNLSLTMRYFTKSNVYGVYGGWVRNRISNEENGGIKDDKVFQDNLEPIRGSILVNLLGAQSKVKNDELFFTQYVSFYNKRTTGKKIGVKDKEIRDNDSLRFVQDSIRLFEKDFSLFEPNKTDQQNDEKIKATDTLNKGQEHKDKKRISFGRLIHSFNFKTNRFITTEAPTPNVAYNQIYNQKYYYRDSVRYYTIENRFFYTNANFMDGVKSQPLIFLAGSNFQYIKMSNYLSSPIDYFQIIPKAMLESNFVGFKIRVEGEIDFGGYNNADFRLNGLLRKTFKYGKNKNSAYVELNGSYIHQMPDYFMQTHNGRVSLTKLSLEGNAYIPDFTIIDNFWHNDFQKIRRANVGLKYKMKDLEIGGNVYSTTNYTYFNEEHTPQQFEGTINGFNLYSKFRVRFWKFYWDNNVVFQMNDKEEYLRLPKFMMSSSLYCSFAMFQKALLVQVGIDAFYNTEYYADNYLASLNTYYLQKDDFAVGNYPYFDAFINLTIKRATLFLKYTHFNKGFMGYSYYYTPHYPYNDGGFHLGVTWRFYD